MPQVTLTTEDAINKFSPTDRGCYACDEAKFRFMPSDPGKCLSQFIFDKSSQPEKSIKNISDPEACEQRWYRYSFSNCQFESVMENILEECGCYPAWMLIHAGNAIKNYYADTRHAEAESCRGFEITFFFLDLRVFQIIQSFHIIRSTLRYEITCYKKILGRMSNYTTITSPEGEKMPCLPACNDQLMAVGD